MHAMLSLIMLLQGVNLAAPPCRDPRAAIDVDTYNLARIYIGDHLPKKGCYLVNVGPEALTLPTSQLEGVEEIISSLPDWMYVALGDSQGEYQCEVNVNGEDYLRDVIDMWLIRWRRGYGKVAPSFLLPRFDDMGSDEVALEFMEHICKKIKHDMPKAAPYVKSMRRQIK